jgi:flagellar FliL protein
MTAAADPDTAADAAPRKKKKGLLVPILVGLVLAGIGGGGGFFAVQMGLVGGGAHDGAEPEEVPLMPLAAAAFVTLDPIIVNLPEGSARSFLRFAGSLEVVPGTEAEVETIKPRIMDVLNGFLRSLTLEDVSDPTALTRLRSQMLRRIQVVDGGDRIRDLLIIEFVVN